MAPGRKLLPVIITVVPPAIEPLFGEIREIAGAGAVEILREKPVDTEADPESFTAIMNANVPAVVGVPAIVPVAKLRVSPVGSCPRVVLHV